GHLTEVHMFALPISVEETFGFWPRRSILKDVLGKDHQRPEPPDHVEQVLEDRVARPEAERLFDRLREAEIVGTRKKLARAVELTGREQLFGADDAELGAELGTDEILAAFPARQREVGGLRAHPARQQHQ